MQDALIYIFLATSTVLLLAFYAMYRKKKALERELLTSKSIPDIEGELKLKREAALREIEELKSLEKDRLEQELRQKRIENDAEIQIKQQSVDNLLEEYKKSQTDAIDILINAKRSDALEAFNLEEEALKEKLLYAQGQILLEEAKIEQFRRNQIEITEALMREAIKREEFNLNLTEKDQNEITELQSVAYKYSRIRPVILKAIYEIYYAPEVKKLIARVVGKEKISGIYRITSRKDGRVYIGKSTDIAKRWVTHFKRAAGVETETTNLLYPAMREDGLNQFSFEIIEVVSDDNLSEREKYWQEFYDAKSHGFSVR